VSKGLFRGFKKYFYLADQIYKKLNDKGPFVKLNYKGSAALANY
jgi:hypothetical protein